MINQIKALLLEGKKVAQIARELNVDRKTVRKYRGMSMEEVGGYREESAERTGKLAGYKGWIREQVDRMAEDGVINSQSIYESVGKMGYQGSARTVRRYVERLRPDLSKTRTYRPFETEPGHQAMVDLGEKRQVHVGALLITVYFAVMVLSWSRRKYVEWFDRPIDTEMFLEFHERAFQYFEGIPQEIVYDQTRLAVLGEHYGEIEFNQGFYSYAQWRRFQPWICRKADPETKGKVEAAVRYVKRGFLPGRRFDHFGDLETQSRRWLAEVTDRKPHETTGRPPGEAWQEERMNLQPVDANRLELAPAFRIQEAQPDGLVKVLANRYSVPPSHHGKQVKVRVGEERVHIHGLDGVHLYTHWRSLEKGQRIMVDEHYARREGQVSRHLGGQLVAVLGRPEWVEQLRAHFPRHFRQQSRQILRLAETVERSLVLQAVERLVGHGCFSYGNLKKTLAYLDEQGAAAQDVDPRHGESVRLPEDLGLINRSSQYYDQVLEDEEVQR